MGLRGSGRGVQETVTPGFSEPWREGKMRELESFGAEVLHSPFLLYKNMGQNKKKYKKEHFLSLVPSCTTITKLHFGTKYESLLST